MTGLHIIVHKTPWDYQKDVTLEVDEYGQKNILGSDPAYKEVHTLLHECIHDLSERDYSEDWLMLVNELLTDSAAEIVLLRTYNQTIASPNEEYIPRTGYQHLVNFARDLVHVNVVSEQELLLYGFKQDPMGFLSLLSGRLQAVDQEVANKLVKSLMARRLIAPAKRADIPIKAAELSKNGAQFLEKEITNMWQILSRAYMGDPFYWDSLIGYLQHIPGYSERMLAIYKEHSPDLELKEDSWILVRDPRDGLLTDEAVEVFNKTYGGPEGKRQNKYWTFSDPDRVGEYLNQHIQEVEISSNTLPLKLHLLGSEDPQTVSDLFRETNFSLGQFHYPHPRADADQKLEMLLEAAPKLYIAVSEVLQKNWGANNVNFNPRDVVRVMRDLMPKWFSAGDVDDIDDLVNKVKIRVEGLTSPFNPTGEFIYVPSKEAVFHYGTALKEAKILQY